jgi:hypothetical protein
LFPHRTTFKVEFPMTHLSQTAPTGQLVSLGKELVSMLQDAAHNGLIAPADAAQANALACMDLLDACKANALLASGSAAKMALDAIAPAFPPGAVVELRALDPAGGWAVSLCGRLDVLAERADLEAFVRTHMARRNIYVGINPRSADFAGTTRAASASDVVGRRSVVLDLDNKDAPDTDPDWSRTIAALKADADPLLILNSGNGFHVWLDLEPISGPDVAASAGPLSAAMARLGADNMADPPRIIRLPFTPNIPSEGKRNKHGAVIRLAAPVPDHNATPRVIAPAPLHAAALCTKLEGVAVRLGLPGRGGAVASPSASRVASGGGEKTGWAAPSLAVLRVALAELPNLPGGAFDDRAEWVNVCHAVKGAAVAGGLEAEGRAAFVAWSDQWGGDPDEPGRVWDTCTNTHMGWGAVMKTLERVNPAGAQRVNAADAAAKFSQQATQNIAALTTSTVQPVPVFVPGQIAPRQWVYARWYIRGIIAALLAEGGVGKSALAMLEAVAMALGLELLAGDKNAVANRPLTVWYHSSEDSFEEQQRRLAAVLLHYGRTHADLKGRLILTSGHDHNIQFAQMGQNGPELTPGTREWVTQTAQSLGVDVLILDPLSATHSLPENSNEAINLLVDSFRRIARDANIAICLVHHVAKAAARDMGSAGAAASRGASALTDAARIVRQLRRPTDKEAAEWGIQPADRCSHIIIENGKANLTRSDDAVGLRLMSVRLGNITNDYPSGDTVQTVERWMPPKPQPVTASDLKKVQDAIEADPMQARASPKSPAWVGYLVADALRLDIGLPKTVAKDRTQEQNLNHARVRALIKGWIADGSLIEKEEYDPADRKDHPFIRVGTPAILLPDNLQNPSAGEAE